jgi:hypothetical protein
MAARVSMGTLKVDHEPEGREAQGHEADVVEARHRPFHPRLELRDHPELGHQRHRVNVEARGPDRVKEGPVVEARVDLQRQDPADQDQGFDLEAVVELLHLCGFGARGDSLEAK